MSLIRIMTNFNIELEFPAASFMRRLAAWLIDLVILFIYIRICISGLESIEKKVSEQAMWIISLLILLPFFLYHLICEILMNGQSLGKKIMQIRVVNENGGQPGIGQYVIRWMIRTSDLMAFIILIIILEASERGGDPQAFWLISVPMALFVTDIILVNATKKNQRLGDMLAHTILIKATEKHTIEDTVFLHVADNYIPSFPQVMQLTDRDMNSLKGILDTARRKGDYNLAEMASDKIKNHLKIQTTLSPFDFLEVLLKDYNYLSAH